ncbi:MAG TPA: thiamine-binding protein [Syntrophomonadaceae bacterium]|nr:thiamine-binding protein [Syntrophomonadaceae bacterium]
MAEANLSLQILPVVAEEEIYPAVDKVIALIARSGLKYEVGPMETTIEGDVKTLLGLVEQSLELCKESGIPRTVAVVKIDYKPTGVTMDEKVGKYRL